jgi:putative ATPase
LSEPDLFAATPEGPAVPLAHRVRPELLSEVEGQPELTREDSWFARALAEGRPVSCIFWGPPGVGKTTLARIMARASHMPLVELSAVSAGKAEVMAVVQQARKQNRTHLLFLDEIHRFNKAQQDVLLPSIEDGTLVLVGATTENPSFSLNNALLSRCRVIVLKALDAAALERILTRALAHQRGVLPGFDVAEDVLAWLARLADGDARYALNALESLAAAGPERRWELAEAQEHWQRRQAQYDRDGEFHYDLISALHKCVRDSDADAACYWLARMLEAGEEPLYLARRMIRMAAEDIGLADPRALSICLDAQRMYQILGSPEGELGLFEAVIYLALAPKSNAAYKAEKGARREAKDSQHLGVPMHLRNAPTKLMKEIGYGEGYRYAHDEVDAVVIQGHFPEGMQPPALYSPTERGFEKTLGERLAWLAARRRDKGGGDKT